MARDAHQDAPLSELHEFIVRARDAEKQDPSPRRRQEWQVTRAAAHAVLARRGSRVALYDLRERSMRPRARCRSTSWRR